VKSIPTNQSICLGVCMLEVAAFKAEDLHMRRVQGLKEGVGACHVKTRVPNPMRL
jgi:hypothetical protein